MGCSGLPADSGHWACKDDVHSRMDRILTSGRIALVALLAVGVSAPAFAQRYAFERSFELGATPVVDITTIRGRIDVRVGEPGRVTVTGAATTRLGLMDPVTAARRAREVADNPPIERDASTLRLRPPVDDAHRDAATVSYEVRVPPNTRIVTNTDSGATSVRDVAGSVTVRTHTAAIDLSGLKGAADITTGSGDVQADGVAGALSVTTSSSRFTGRGLAGGLRLRTSTGAVIAAFTGSGAIDVETGSSAIQLSGISGALTVVSRSGRLTIAGAPAAPWALSTGSGSMELAVASSPGVNVDLTTGSGSIKVVGASVQGQVTKRSVSGTIGNGGQVLRATSRSGSVVVRVAALGVTSRPAPGE